MTDHTRLHGGDQHGDEKARNGATGHGPVTFDCEYCEVILRAQTFEAMKDRGTTHLAAHKSTLFEVFADKRRGKHCQNECGYEFPVGGDQGMGFECPQCGYENFGAFAHRYLYWRIDYPENNLTESGRE